MKNESKRHVVPTEHPFTPPLQSLRAKKLTDWAKALHEARNVYALYGALDGLSLSYSMLKYLFDLMFANYASQMLHQWMETPGGALAVGSESLVIVAFSMMGNLFEDDDPNRFKRYMAIVWPYCRDTVKGLKNGYKGVRGAIQMTSFVSGTNFNDMIMPIGLGLGVLAVLNRMLMRHMVTGRKQMMKQNAELLQDVQSANPKNADQFLNAKIGRQAHATRTLGLLGAFCGGVVDSLYLYMGVLSVVSLSPALFTCVAAFSVLFTLSNIVTRVYEEYDYQRSLVISQKKIELAILGKQLERLFNDLEALRTISSEEGEKRFEQLNPKKLHAIKEKINEFSRKQKALHELVNRSNISAALTGLKDGLVAYSAISSLIFAGVTITTMLSVAFPPSLVLASVLLGLASVIGFVSFALQQNRHYHQINPERPSHQKWADLVKTVHDDKKTVEHLKPQKVKEAIFDGMAIDPLPQFYFQEWLEVLRSWISGFSKGPKTTISPLQEIDDNGNSHGSVFSLVGTVVSATVYSFGLGARAFARGLGRPPIGMPKADSPIPKSNSTSDIGRSERTIFEKPISEHTRKRSNSAPPTFGIREFGFFTEPKSKSPTPSRHLIPGLV